MKKEQELDLKKAFRPMPLETRNKAIAAACSVKEEKPMKRNVRRTLLLAAVLAVLGAAVALAAGTILGWDTFLGKYGITVQETAQRIMEDSGERVFVLGPAVFEAGDLYCDGHVGMARVHVHIDGEAIICPDDPDMRLSDAGSEGTHLAQTLGVEESLTWLEAAQTLERPLYRARAVLEVPEALRGGEETEEVLTDTDGSAVCYSIAAMNGQARGDTVQCTLYLRLAKLDADGEEETVYTDRQELPVFLEAPLESGTYQVPENAVLNGLHLQAVRAELLPGGLYFTADFEAEEGTDKDAADALLEAEFLQGDGTPYPMGVTLSGNAVTEDWPRVHLERMVSANGLPERTVLFLPAGGERVTLELEEER